MTPAEVILTHHRRPHHRGLLLAPDAVATRHNALCGETLTVSITLDADRDRVREVTFDGESCSIGRASASMMTDLVAGLTREEIASMAEHVKALVSGDPDAVAVTEGDLKALAEVRRTPARAACALLPWDALSDALADAHR
jgi:nitrogen fixation protein NifU and related proteins